MGRCNTQVRYVDPDQTLSPGEFASRAATACLFENGVDASEIDLLVYGGIARENFEPATAAEVAGRLGARPLHAFDVTCACAGLVEAIHVVAGYFALHPEIKTALVCAGELWRDRVTYDLQTLDDVANLAAGLTLGNAAAAFLVTRESLPAGSARLLGFQHKTLAEHYDLCSAPIDGHFVSRSKELFALAVHVPGEVQRLLASRAGRPKTSTTTSSTSPARRSWSASSTQSVRGPRRASIRTRYTGTPPAPHGRSRSITV